MSALETRVSMLERRLDSTLSMLPADRNAMPMGPRRGRWYGKLTTALAVDGTCNVDVWAYDIPDDEWRTITPAVNKEDVRSFFNIPLPIGYPVMMEWIGNTWAIVDFQRYPVGKADSSISKGATGTISLWTYNGSAMVDTTMNVTAIALGDAISTSKWVSLEPGEKIWHVGKLEC